MIEGGSFWQSWGCGSWPRSPLNAVLLLNLKFLLLWWLHWPPGWPWRKQPKFSSAGGKPGELAHAGDTFSHSLPFPLHSYSNLPFFSVFISVMWPANIWNWYTHTAFMENLSCDWNLGINLLPWRRNNTGVLQGVVVGGWWWSCSDKYCSFHPCIAWQGATQSPALP